jgi:hypothetical protein
MMAAVGRTAWAARPEMPGAAGAYAALDRVHSSLEAKQGELKAIESEIGPVWDAEAAGFLALKRPLTLVGGIAGGIVFKKEFRWPPETNEVPPPAASKPIVYE